MILAIAFATMAIAVSARTAFSLLLPPLIDEFGWDRGVAAGAFSFGFLFTAFLSPLAGRLMDRRGPRFVIEAGVAMMTAGLFLAAAIERPWHLYLTLGVLAGGGANLMSYTAQSQYLPNWFVRRRAFAIGLAFSGAGVGAIVLLPWWQTVIAQEGWRAACITMGILVAVVLAPVNLAVWGRPADVGLRPDGHGDSRAAGRHGPLVVDAAWASTEWTLARACRTGRFWWLMLAFACAMVAWYAVQVHQTKYLIEVGFPPLVAAWALGAVAVIGVPGQVALGALSDRIGREWVWVAGCAGFAVCYAALMRLEHDPSEAMLYLMIASQGFLGYALPSVLGPMVAEIFEGPHYGSIFGTMSIALVGGGAAGPWMAGAVHDATGSYAPAFALAIACCVVSALAVWIAAPRKVRLVPGLAAARERK